MWNPNLGRISAGYRGGALGDYPLRDMWSSWCFESESDKVNSLMGCGGTKRRIIG